MSDIVVTWQMEEKELITHNVANNHCGFYHYVFKQMIFNWRSYFTECTFVSTGRIYLLHELTQHINIIRIV